ncbi:MAG: PIN domain-containing protein [Candidatus Korobacteraceae bacterium]
MKTRVLDSWAIIEWLRDQTPARDIVATLLTEARDGSARLFISAINVGEVYYVLRKHRAEAAAERWCALAGTLPATIEVPTLDDIWEAASLKSQFRIAYADAFAAALAKKHHCPVLTGDAEFRMIPGLELDWIDRTM